jgi:hypothetical protein
MKMRQKKATRLKTGLRETGQSAVDLTANNPPLHRWLLAVL